MAVPAIWGGTFVAGKIVVAVVVAIDGFVRALRDRLCGAAGCGVRAGRWIAAADAPAMAGDVSCSACFGVFAYNLFFMGALQRLPASRAALIIALNPVITIAISSLSRSTSDCAPRAG